MLKRVGEVCGDLSHLNAAGWEALAEEEALAGDERGKDRAAARFACDGILISAADFQILEELRRQARATATEGSMRLKTEFFKSGDAMSIRTNASTEGDFLTSVAGGLTQLIDGGTFAGDWEFQLQLWLPQIVDIACKLRGYKADVDEQRVLIAGARMIHESDRVMVTEPVAVG
jgi:hypothetical protein